MENAAVVHNDAIVTLVGFVIVIILLLLLVKNKFHIFLSMLIPILFFGFIPGVNIFAFTEAFEKGFGQTVGGIAVIIILGCIIAEALKHTGAIDTITNTLIKLVGEKRMPLALTLSGIVLGVAIFSDVAFVILNPLVHSSAKIMGVSMGTMSTGLVGSLQLTHAMVPPAAGPLAASILIGADIGKVIIVGGFVCLVGSLAGWIWGQFIVGPRIDSEPSDEFIGMSDKNEENGYKAIPVPKAFAPTLIPISLIALHSIAKLFLSEDNLLRVILSYVGWPVIALGLGVCLAFRNIQTEEDRKNSKTIWVENALRTSAMILAVTGLGGSLSHILRGTPAVDFVAEYVVVSGLPSIFLPFLLGMLTNLITGSTTVGVITASALMAPMIGNLGLSPEAAMLAGASGSVIIKYVNSSYFWVCTSLSRMEVKNALICYGGTTLIGGIVCFSTVYLLWIAGLI